MKRPIIKDKRSFQGMDFEIKEGETIEQKVKRIVEENEPIKDGAPIIYTEMKDGVKPEFNPRTDKWELAIMAMDKVSNYEASKYLNGVDPNNKPEVGKKNESTDENAKSA